MEPKSISNSQGSILLSPSELENIQNSLVCPIELEPLFEAVSLMPCTHKINQVAAERLFGATRTGTRREVCPICRVEVCDYQIDHTVRDLAKAFFKLSLDREKQESNESNEPIAKLMLDQGSWPQSEQEFFPIIKFTSLMEDSIIQELTIIFLKTGDFMLTIKFKIDDHRVKSYLSKQNIQLEEYQLNCPRQMSATGYNLGSYTPIGTEKTRKLFQAIHSIIQLPEEYDLKIQMMLINGVWKEV